MPTLERFNGSLPLRPSRFVLPNGLSLSGDVKIVLKSGPATDQLLIGMEAARPDHGSSQVLLHGIVPGRVLEAIPTLPDLMLGAIVSGQMQTSRKMHLGIGLVPEGLLEVELDLVDNPFARMAFIGPRMADLLS